MFDGVPSNELANRSGGVVPRRITVVRPVDPNERERISASDDGRSIEVSAEQNSKALFPMVTNDEENVTVVRLEQPLKASVPMSITPSGNPIDVKLVAFLKAAMPTRVSWGGRLTAVIASLL